MVVTFFLKINPELITVKFHNWLNYWNGKKQRTIWTLTLPQVVNSWSFNKSQSGNLLITGSFTYMDLSSNGSASTVSPATVPSITFSWPHNSASDLQYVDHKKYEQRSLQFCYSATKIVTLDESWDEIEVAVAFFPRLRLNETLTSFALNQCLFSFFLNLIYLY